MIEIEWKNYWGKYMVTSDDRWIIGVDTKFAYLPVRAEQLYIHPFRDRHKRWVWFKTYYEVYTLFDANPHKFMCTDEALKSWGIEIRRLPWYY